MHLRANQQGAEVVTDTFWRPIAMLHIQMANHFSWGH